MAKGRKNGCPTNIRDWAIFIQDKTAVQETWVRIKGLTQMTRGTGSNTEDGSAVTDNWEEPYVTKRNGTLKLEGKPLFNASTGAKDAGQTILDNYATETGCDGDATIKIVDPYGTTVVGDYIVTDTEDGSDDTEDTASWDLEQVGEVEVLPYVQVSSVALKDGDNAVSTLSLSVGDAAKVITIAFTPDNASNQRFRVSTSNKRVAAVGSITDTGFSITATGAGTANVTVTTVNGAKTATIAVTVA